MRLNSITSLRESQDLRADAIDLAHLKANTIGSSEIGVLRWGDTPYPDIISQTVEQIERDLRNDLSTSAISAAQTDGLGHATDRTEHLVVRDLDLDQVEPSLGAPRKGRIVAHAEHAYCPADWFTRHRFEPSRSSNAGPGLPVLYDIFTASIYEVSERLVGGEECYMLMALHTLDSHLRRGIASDLVRWIFPYAQATNRPLFLVASPVGAHVYRKLGYEDVEEEDGLVEIPLEEWGGSTGAVHQLVAMRREPSDERSVVSSNA